MPADGYTAWMEDDDDRRITVELGASTSSTNPNRTKTALKAAGVHAHRYFDYELGDLKCARSTSSLRRRRPLRWPVMNFSDADTYTPRHRIQNSTRTTAQNPNKTVVWEESPFRRAAYATAVHQRMRTRHCAQWEQGQARPNTVFGGRLG